MTTLFTAPATDRIAEARTMLIGWAEAKPTGLYSRRRVIDHLLDLRNTLPERQRPVVDAILADVPGVTVVESEWWLDRIAWLAGYLDHPANR